MPSKAKRSLLDFNEKIPEERLIDLTDLEHCLASRPIWKVPKGLQGDNVYHLDWLSRLPLSDEIRLSRMAYKLDRYRDSVPKVEGRFPKTALRRSRRQMELRISPGQIRSYSIAIFG